jgi:RNase H-fold protein (predicted Holliday junction resolvase)
MLALALDMGGTHIGCGVVEEDRLLAHAAKVRRVRLGRSLCTMQRRLSCLLRWESTLFATWT